MAGPKGTYSGLQAKRREKQRISTARSKARLKKLGRSRGTTGGNRIKILG